MKIKPDLSGSRDFAASLRLRLYITKLTPQKKYPWNFTLTQKRNWFHIKFWENQFSKWFFKEREPKSRLPDNSR